MTLDEARVLLGVDASTSADEARRAYLRLVKQHRPEQDPAGFQRVREAYDLVRQLQPLRVDEALARARVEASTEAAVVSVADLGVPEAPATPSVADLRTFYEQAEALEAGDNRGAIAIWRAAVRAHPESAEAHQQLVEAYTEAGNEERAGRALRRGYRRGLSGFAPRLLAQAPAHAPPELYERAKHNGELALAAAAGHLNQGAPRAALLYLRVGIESGAGNSFQTTHLVIEALGRLGEQADAARFKKLARLFANHVKENQIALWGPHAAQWLVLRELSAVASRLPKFVFSALAGSIFERNARSLPEDLALFAERNPTRAARARQVLKARAPSLHGAYAALLTPPARPTYSNNNWKFGWMPLLMFAFFMVRLLAGSGSRAEHADVYRPPPPSTIPTPARVAPGHYDEAKVEQAVGDLYSLAREQGLSDLQDRLSTANRAFLGDCRRLAGEMDDVIELARNRDGMRDHLETLWVEFERACPVQASTVPRP